MIQAARERLARKVPADFGELFLRAEKFEAIDGLAANNNFAMDFIRARYLNLKAATAKIFSAGPINDEQIEAFRRLVIDDALYNYKRDYPNLTATFLGWGGNCVAQAMLMTALLEPYRERLPSGYQLVVSLWRDHIETGLWNGSSIKLLVSGSDTDDISGTLYRPEFLLVMMLRNYPGGLDNLKYENPRIPVVHSNLPSQPEEDDDKTAGGKHDRRRGILERTTIADLDPGTRGAGGGGGGGNVPYSATMNFSKMQRTRGPYDPVRSLKRRMSERSDSDVDDDDDGNSPGGSGNSTARGGGENGSDNVGSAMPARPKFTTSVNFGSVRFCVSV